MNKILLIVTALISSLLISCDSTQDQQATETILKKVDDASQLLATNIEAFKTVAVLDHHRMAEAAGVYTPPSIATIFSDALVNTNILAVSQEAGLDLPFKVLCYSEPDTSEANIAITSAEFIIRRHNIGTDVLSDYAQVTGAIIDLYDASKVATTDYSSVTADFGIVKIQSDFGFEETVENLREIVMSQDDTKWFADIDYQAEAEAFDVALRPTTLLLFGGPAPGGQAMKTSPRIGLDAFCQKLLVYENSDAQVWIAYNDIVAFAELYYGSSTKPQQMINERLRATFTKAVQRQD